APTKRRASSWVSDRSRAARAFGSSLAAGIILICGSSRVADATMNGLALSPPLGWSSWSSFQANVDEESIKARVQVQASTLKASGYVYVNVDAGWDLNPVGAVDPFCFWLRDATEVVGGYTACGDYMHEIVPDVDVCENC